MAENLNNTNVHVLDNVEAQNSAPAAPPPKKSGVRKLILPVIIIAALAGVGYEGYNWWTNGRFMVSTDDAYTGGDIAYISPKVSGYVRSVNVKANQYVKAGTPLVTLDDRDYAIALESAKAKLTSQKLSLKLIDSKEQVAVAALASANAQKLAAEATLHGAQQKQGRASKLQSRAIASTSTLDSANIVVEQAQANLKGAEAAIQSAQANIASIKAQYNQAASIVKSLDLAQQKAQRDMSFTVLRAPYDGIVGNLSVQKGDLVSPGVRLAALVPSDQLYISANFKETQIAKIQIGQDVQIHVDALGDTPIEGKVASISPATGAVFSLLPPQNATGNFTKIIQRLPVRISVPKKVLDAHRLMAGLSVVVKIDTRTTPKSNK